MFCHLSLIDDPSLITKSVVNYYYKKLFLSFESNSAYNYNKTFDKLKPQWLTSIKGLVVSEEPVNKSYLDVLLFLRFSFFLYIHIRIKHPIISSIHRIGEKSLKKKYYLTLFGRCCIQVKYYQNTKSFIITYRTFLLFLSLKESYILK